MRSNDLYIRGLGHKSFTASTPKKKPVIDTGGMGALEGRLRIQYTVRLRRYIEYDPLCEQGLCLKLGEIVI